MAGLPVVITLPSYPTAASIKSSVMTALDFYETLITNYNDGGVTATYIEAIALTLGSDASTYPGVTQPGAYQLLTTLQQSAFILTAKGPALDAKCADVNVYRKQPVYASVPVVFTLDTAPTAPFDIPAGTLVSAEPADPSQAPILFATSADVQIQAGLLSSPAVGATALVAGSSGNVGTGTVNSVVSGVAGLTVNNPQPGTGGYDLEGDDAPNGGLRARGLAAIPNAAQCTKSAIVQAALAYAGIVSAYLVENVDQNGNFTRGLCQLYVDDGTGNIGSITDPNNASMIQLQIDLNQGRYRAAGVQVIVNGATQVAVQVSLGVDLSAIYVSGFTSLAVAQQTATVAIQQAITNWVDALTMGSPVTLADIIMVAAGVPGVSNVDVSSVQINGVAADLLALGSQVPKISNPANVSVTIENVTSYA
jgi:uncharacterized phage protein gp47/JayE